MENRFKGVSHITVEGCEREYGRNCTNCDESQCE